MCGGIEINRLTQLFVIIDTVGKFSLMSEFKELLEPNTANALHIQAVHMDASSQSSTHYQLKI